jgi:hypothetical protein
MNREERTNIINLIDSLKDVRSQLTDAHAIKTMDKEVIVQLRKWCKLAGVKWREYKELHPVQNTLALTETVV